MTKNKETVFSFIKDQKGIILVVILIILSLILLILPSGSSKSASNNNLDRLSEYEDRVEKKIAQLCSEVKGVSSVSVSVYFDSGFESVYAFDEESRNSSGSTNTEKKYVTLGSGSDESMVCLYERMPSISGVAIVCKGGGNPLIANELINMISSAFNVPKNKIYVTEGKK